VLKSTEKNSRSYLLAVFLRRENNDSTLMISQPSRWCAASLVQLSESRSARVERLMLTSGLFNLNYDNYKEVLWSCQGFEAVEDGKLRALAVESDGSTTHFLSEVAIKQKL
jgi:hypothetical protein